MGQYRFLLGIAVLSVIVLWVSMPAVDALTNKMEFNNRHTTGRHSYGIKVCGEHICAPGEYQKMKQEMLSKQMKDVKCKEALRQGKKC